jgi:hypothetical protein
MNTGEIVGFIFTVVPFFFIMVYALWFGILRDLIIDMRNVFRGEK